MSGYRSLKRVLGESNLERKCRTLFGLCVASLHTPLELVSVQDLWSTYRAYHHWLTE